MDEFGSLLPDVVDGLSACLSIPRHSANDLSFITAAFRKVQKRHDALLGLIDEMAPHFPQQAGRLLEACAVERFGHVMRGVAPGIAAAFIAERDAANLAAYHRILQCSVPLESATTAFSTMLGGPGIKALLPHNQGRYLGAYHQAVGPLCSRLRRVGASLPRRLAVQLADPDSGSLPCLGLATLGSLMFSLPVCKAPSLSRSCTWPTALRRGGTWL